MLPLNSASTMPSVSASATTAAVKDNYLDQNSLNAVKAMGRHNDPAALKEISKKFEAMFVQQMLKSMREANEVFSDGDPFSSEEVKFHQEMLDQQMVLNLTSGQGMGLAKSMYQQMQRLYGKGKDAVEGIESLIKTDKKIELVPAQRNIKPLTSANETPSLFSRAGIKNAIATTAEEFIAKVKPYAEKAAAELNINTDVLLAQAALETGWGKHLIHDAEGNNSFNIFNIKASGNWQGKSVAVNTLENKQGITQQERAEFRQYDNYVQSFTDYVNLIKNNPRYEKALQAGDDSHAYAKELQRAGYATDPAYAEKIKRLLNSDAIRSAVDKGDDLALTPNLVAMVNDGEQS